MRMHSFAFLFSLLLIGCQKNDKTQLDVSKVRIEVIAPQNGQIFGNGDTVYLDASINFDGQLHGSEVKIIDTITGFTLYDVAQHVHSDKFAISEKWLNELVSPVVLKVIFIAYIDHSGNTVEQERYITTTP